MAAKNPTKTSTTPEAVAAAPAAPPPADDPRIDASDDPTVTRIDASDDPTVTRIDASDDPTVTRDSLTREEKEANAHLRLDEFEEFAKLAETTPPDAAPEGAYASMLEAAGVLTSIPDLSADDQTRAQSIAARLRTRASAFLPKAPPPKRFRVMRTGNFITPGGMCTTIVRDSVVSEITHDLDALRQQGVPLEPLP